MQDELIKSQPRYQRAIIFISRERDKAMRISDRIAIMQGCEVVQVSTPDEIFNSGVDISQVFSAKDKDIARRRPVTLICQPGRLARAPR
ncbi:MAG: Glycine betaine/proline betaine transport system ATP-binding protein ProV [Sodalis sp.]|nr:MAG: Glycine betaine/proline betaine transport system ATP-binding protein ProV [Sodalis sp.]